MLFLGEWSAFSFFKCSDNQTYAAIIISLVSIGLLFNIKNRNIWLFFETIWEFSSVILSDVFARRITGNLKRSIAAIWLLVCILLLSLYSGGLYESLVRKQPIDKIDSWDDLYTKPHWKKFPIYAPDFGDLFTFISFDSSPMALDFRKRTVMLDAFKFAFDLNWAQNQFIQCVNGEKSCVVLLDYLMLHYFKHKYGAGTIKSEGIDFHISKSGYAVKPQFILLTKRADIRMVNMINFV